MINLCLVSDLSQFSDSEPINGHGRSVQFIRVDLATAFTGGPTDKKSNRQQPLGCSIIPQRDRPTIGHKWIISDSFYPGKGNDSS